MNRIITQGLLIVVVFFASLFVINQIDWMTLLQVKDKTDNLEEKLGDLFYESIVTDDNEIIDEFVKNSIDSIFIRITKANHIATNKIKVHIIKDSEVNAFALPGNHLIVNSGLIIKSDTPEELAGVLSHEIAHIQLDHIMKKLVKEVGISVLVSMAGGNSGTEVLGETVKYLSSTAFDRKMEKEADLKAVDYLINAKIEPNDFADFFYKLEGEHEYFEHFSWLSTHPQLKERAKYIVEYINESDYEVESVISNTSWQKLKADITT